MVSLQFYMHSDLWNNKEIYTLSFLSNVELQLYLSVCHSWEEFEAYLSILVKHFLKLCWFKTSETFLVAIVKFLLIFLLQLR